MFHLISGDGKICSFLRREIVNYRLNAPDKDLLISWVCAEVFDGYKIRGLIHIKRNLFAVNISLSISSKF
jgi:hypothetical protein